jgi:hypothetical protein
MRLPERRVARVLEMDTVLKAWFSTFHFLKCLGTFRGDQTGVRPEALQKPAISRMHAFAEFPQVSPAVLGEFGLRLRVTRKIRTEKDCQSQE